MKLEIDGTLVSVSMTVLFWNDFISLCDLEFLNFDFFKKIFL